MRIDKQIPLLVSVQQGDFEVCAELTHTSPVETFYNRSGAIYPPWGLKRLYRACRAFQGHLLFGGLRVLLHAGNNCVPHVG